ncbi:hypothetical protein A6V36_27590 [Paraburkholderia ginsengiterrae]|uniref:Uncharacterized protein n=2 Tax=Paraburkholderia ginsengiterrae TaxID=1462993 RepID=A0A1A9NC65_9BURK|nr:hypothetical protein A6V36_27590 [Paraburkholderia ginsengiterrae]OAJ63322.1 hypothetical protein A6V37_20740 [Paraburkholderia ginsengiterrae]
MKSFAKYLAHGLVASAMISALGFPVAQAQMVGDSGLRSALTSSLLQTTQQKHRRRISNDPYMALIAQSDPDRRLRELTSNTDPLSPTAQITTSRTLLAGQMALASGMGGAGALAGAMSMKNSALLSLPGMRKAGGGVVLPSMVPGMNAASLPPASMLNMSGIACSMPLSGMTTELHGASSCR